MTAVAAIYDPAPVQQEMHLCKATEILLGGAAGPGKSLGLLMDPVQTQLYGEHQRWMETGEKSLGWAIHFRREFPMLQQTIERSHRMFRAIDGGAHYDSTRHMWEFSCGYKLQFGHIKHDEDRFNYLSNEYTALYFDELAEFSREVYELLTTRVRSSDPILRTKLRIVSATNPSGNWVRDVFVAPCHEGRKLLTRTILTDDGVKHDFTRIFIPATLKDNPDAAFRASYELQLQARPAHIRKAYLYGDWWVIPGAFFAEEFVPSIHVVPKFKIPNGWTKFRSMDWGYKSYGVVLWWAVDKDENLICYREFTFKGMDAAAVAQGIRKIEIDGDEWDHKNNQSRLDGPADTQIWEQRGTIGPTIHETMGNEGVFWQKCTKNRLASVSQLLGRLKDRSGENGVPAIRFFGNCKNTIRTIPARGTDPNNPELPEDGGEDHWLDAVLYACMFRAATPKHDTLPHSREFYDEMEEARARKSRRQKAAAGSNWGYR